MQLETCDARDSGQQRFETRLNFGRCLLGSRKVLILAAQMETMRNQEPNLLLNVVM